MRELIIHEFERPEVVSIKPVEPSEYSDRVFMTAIIELFIRRETYFFFGGNVQILMDSDKILKRINKTLNPELFYLDSYTIMFSIDFLSKRKENIIDVVDVFKELWLSFEQPYVVISYNNFFKSISEKDIRSLVLKNCNFIIDKLDASYAICKGVEDDVIWLIRNKNEKFPELESILKY